MKHLLSFFLLLSFLLNHACGRVPEGSSNPTQQEPTTDENNGLKLAADPTHLLFSGIDPVRFPWQNSLYSVDLNTLAVTKLLSGESSDTVLFPSAGELLFFNRSMESQNFRRIVPLANNTFKRGVQQGYRGGSSGDPHDVLDLANGRVLLANYVAGTLSIMEQKSGSIVASINERWDIPDGEKLHIEALMRVNSGTQQFIYAVHQALSLKDGLMLPNGTQQVFILKEKDQQIQPIYIASNPEKVSGIKLQGSFPIPVRYAKGRTKPLLVSLCSRFILSAAQTRGLSCSSAIEEIDPTTHQAKVLWDFAGQKIFMNGPVVPGPDQNSFYAAVEKQRGEATFSQEIVLIDSAKKSITSVYNFAEGSGGYWGIFYNESTKTLYIGDIGSDTVGKLVILKSGSARKEITLPAVPLNGVLFANSAL